MPDEYAPVLVPIEHRAAIERYVAQLEARESVREDVAQVPLRQ